MGQLKMLSTASKSVGGLYSSIGERLIGKTLSAVIFCTSRYRSTNLLRPCALEFSIVSLILKDLSRNRLYNTKNCLRGQEVLRSILSPGPR